MTLPIKLSRWRSERYWRIVVLKLALLLWTLLAVSIIGLVYALLLGMFFFVAHTIFIAHLRGSAVRLGETQLPELYERVTRLAARLGLERVPEAYLVQTGGSLNALATGYLGRDCIVLFSELVDACGDNGAALDFIIAHELAHLRAGHLRWNWLLLPGLVTPLVGTAYSRACEYTADGIAHEACQRDEAALQGLLVLAAGGRLAGAVDRQQLIAQAGSLNTPLMKLGHWLTSHPPISLRLAALLGSPVERAPLAGLGAAGIVVLGVGLPVIIGMAGIALIAHFGSKPEAEMQATAPAAVDEHWAQIEQGILALARSAESARTDGELPADGDALYALWNQHHPGEPAPLDPYTGDHYRYETTDGHYRIWSIGPDPDSFDDDIFYDSAHATTP
jgi:Zn-dependent protease with chaperone function